MIGFEGFTHWCFEIFRIKNITYFFPVQFGNISFSIPFYSIKKILLILGVFCGIMGSKSYCYLKDDNCDWEET